MPVSSIKQNKEIDERNSLLSSVVSLHIFGFFGVVRSTKIDGPGLWMTDLGKRVYVTEGPHQGQVGYILDSGGQRYYIAFENSSTQHRIHKNWCTVLDDERFAFLQNLSNVSFPEKMCRTR